MCELNNTPYVEIISVFSNKLLVIIRAGLL